ncbi:TetR/AcrR family transcriptional regulator [Kitasatospora sp. NPDC056076]|uniref:TetR/AcrR family transcriptional regulator n=1 Tax=Kitasatospora sp. NPDC056076 TaxID=3345703 RepID=UPI0035D82694
MAERRRGPALEKALLDAAWAELADHGYARFTMDAVVKRAGTSPPVLYRRWPNRDELARAAIVHAVRGARIDTPDTGSLRGDVLTLMREINTTRVELITVVQMHLAGYRQESGTSPADLVDPLVTGRAEALDLLFARAAARGEVDPARLTPRLKSLPFDLLRLQILTTFAPAPDDVLEEIVDTLFLPLLH